MASRPDHRAPWDGDRLPEGEAKVQAVREMFDAIAPRYDLVNRLMTFRLDVRWRRLAVRSLDLQPGSLVADPVKRGALPLRMEAVAQTDP